MVQALAAAPCLLQLPCRPYQGCVTALFILSRSVPVSVSLHAQGVSAPIEAKLIQQGRGLGFAPPPPPAPRQRRRFDDTPRDMRDRDRGRNRAPRDRRHVRAKWRP